jgi:hypothetical protein
MKIQSERAGQRRRWSFETTGAIDRSVAMFIVLLVLIVAHLLGVDAEVAKLLTSAIW